MIETLPSVVGRSTKRNVASDDLLYLSFADAERLMVQHRFITNQNQAACLADLERRIAAAVLLDPSQITGDLVTMNSRVLLLDLDTECRIAYTLAFPACANARKGELSILGSMGTALLGARVGQVIRYESSAGPRRALVKEILYQPEAAGDYYG